MPRRRFSRIKESPRLEDAYNAFKTWQDRTRPVNYTRGADSNTGGFVKKSVKSFGKLGENDLIIKVSRRASNFEPLTTAIATRVSSSLTGAIAYPGFEPAKVVLFAGTGSTSPERSRITNLDYKKRVGKSYTHAFGANTATEGEMEAQQAIATALLAQPNRAVSFQPERRYFY